MRTHKSASKRAALPARDRILETAHDLFYREGIRATGVDSIIAASGVAKVTFYRHFPSKNELIKAVLEYRHHLWIAWFTDALSRQRKGGLDALVPALEEWFTDKGYRGCAFINAVVEVGGVFPEAVEISRQHKQQMVQIISTLLPPSSHRKREAEAVAMLVDGAIVHAQMAETPDTALQVLKTALHSIQASHEQPSKRRPSEFAS